MAAAWANAPAPRDRMPKCSTDVLVLMHAASMYMRTLSWQGLPNRLVGQASACDDFVGQASRLPRAGAALATGTVAPRQGPLNSPNKLNFNDAIYR